MLRFTFLLLLLGLISCNSKSNKNDLFQLSTDVEVVTAEGVKAGEYFLSGQKLLSENYSKSGQYSVKTSPKNKFALQYVFENIKKGDVIVASVWRKSEVDLGGIVIEDGLEPHKQYMFNEMVVKESNGWQKVQTKFKARHDYEKVKVYVLNPSDTYIYYDDYEIRHYSNTSFPDDSYDALELEIPESAMDSIKQFRKLALKQGVISKNLKKYFKANVVYDGKTVPVKIRLKGDWTDHLEGDKWSYRIKVVGDNSIMGLKTFSIQDPKTRSGMREWLAHKFFEQEDVLTTTYEFVPVIVNGQKKGVYAIEEHFDKQLLESRSRREGPIVKFDESGIWESNLRIEASDEFLNAANYEASDIIPFKKKRTLKSEVLKSQFESAQVCMEAFRQKLYDLDNFVDYEAMAKYLAMSDVLDGKHGVIWHNQRFYYNGITKKIEPIAYDCYTEETVSWEHNHVMGYDRFEEGDKSSIDALFYNRKFNERYVYYLSVFSDVNYIKRIVSKHQDEINRIEKLFQFEDPSYNLDLELLEENAWLVTDLWGQYGYDSKEIEIPSDMRILYTDKKDGFIYQETSLKANLVKKENGVSTINLRNFHGAGIQVIGYSLKANQDSLIKFQVKNLKAYRNKAHQVKVKLQGKIKRFYFKASNCGDVIYHVNVSKIKNVEGLSLPAKVALPSFVRKASKGFVVDKGSYVAKQDIIIPAGSKLVLEAGAQIDFVNGAGLVSYSPVSIRGKRKDSVLIFSSDHSASGFTVIAPEQSSTVNYARFDGFKSLTKNGWHLTGAVTFYESNLTMTNSIVQNNLSEDALNCVRSSINLSSCIVRNTYSDGIDADFCIGKIYNCTLEKTGNDGLDFSGSELIVSSCKVYDAGDKALSGGENSTVEVKDFDVYGAYIAVASKDKSTVTVSGLNVYDAQYGFAAYRKKPEYGPATIVVNSAGKAKWKKQHLIEKDSKLVYLKEEVIGEKKFNIDSLYARYK